MIDDFITWLERREIELFHGSTTGQDRLQSFKQKGILPKSSSGHGQGAGFYAYSDKEQAKNHAVGLINNNSGKTNQQHSGEPMVVTHKAKLNPRDYELDKEVQGEDISRFFKAHENEIDELIKKNPITIQPDGKYGSWVQPTTLYSMFYEPRYNNIGFWTTKNIDVNNAVQEKDYFYISPNNVNDAADLNLIMQSLFKQFPSIAKSYQAYVRTIMKRSSEGRANPRAYKYVGDKSLPANRIMVKDGNSWSNKI